MAETPQALAVGDYVRLKTRDGNQHISYKAGAGEVTSYREPIDGLILSIRDVKSGKLVPATERSIDQYVVELVYTRTFNTRFASLRNAPRGTDDPTSTAGWKRLRATLRKAVEEGNLYSTAVPDLLTNSPLASLLDGWKVVKIWAQEMVNLEKPATQEAHAE